MNNSLDVIRTLEFQDYQLCYRDVGQGPIVILLHGWSLNSTYWTPQIQLLSKNYRVIAYDWRGMGCSSGGQKPFDFKELYEEAKAVLSSLCADQKPTLIGHSLGGNIALNFAIENSEQLSGVAVVDAPLPHWFKETLLSIVFRCVSERMSLKLMSAFAKRALWGVRYARAHPDIMADWQTQFCSNSVPALINALRAWAKRPNPIPNLDKIKVQSLLVAGAGDSLTCKDMQALQKAWAGAKLHMITNASHMSFVEQPDEFNKLVATFLAGLPRT